MMSSLGEAGRDSAQQNVDPAEVQELINQVTSTRHASEGAPYNLAENESETSMIIDRASDVEALESTELDATVSGLSVRKGKSYPSTVYDRGDSERLRDNNAVETSVGVPPRLSDDVMTGTGAWQDDESSMAKRLQNALVKNADGREFLPLDALEAIVTENAVGHELRQHAPRCRVSAGQICQRQVVQDENYPRTRYTSLQKIFATLVFMDQIDLIADFVEENIRDTDLPLKKHNARHSTFLVSRSVTGDPSPTYRLQTAQSWEPAHISLFERQQWVMLAPFFARAEDLGEKVHFYSLDTNDILPFMKPGTDDLDGGRGAFLYAGFFGTLRRVKIHPAHHNFLVDEENQGADFAVKRLARGWHSEPANHKEEFDQEVEALKKFSQRNERYIIKLLATYEINGRYHLLFPVADGNLMTFWENHKNPEIVQDAALWLAQECHGIAEALLKIHRYNFTPPSIGSSMDCSSNVAIHGIHGDIKPQNVLWFKTLPRHLTEVDNNSNGNGDVFRRVPISQPRTSELSKFGFLQISDFGTVNFHRYITRKKASILVQQGSYRAPEADFKENNIGSSLLDIWSLGCLYLDFITWYLRGWDSVGNDFPKARADEEPLGDDVQEDKFFIRKTHVFTGREFYMVKSSVTEWIVHLHKEPRCSPFIHDFLDFIETNMLIVPLSDRCDSSTVVWTLMDFLNKCQSSRHYREIGEARRWAIWKSHIMTLRASIHKIGQTINSHGLAVCLVALIVLVLTTFLIMMFGPRVDGYANIFRYPQV
ncbi:kinase-like domain-containing protein [Whalleya microplaca]|nr:kinase-like domain-containing protein [Whalleya microplaca]